MIVSTAFACLRKKQCMKTKTLNPIQWFGWLGSCYPAFLFASETRVTWTDIVNALSEKFSKPLEELAYLCQHPIPVIKILIKLCMRYWSCHAIATSVLAKMAFSTEREPGFKVQSPSSDKFSGKLNFRGAVSMPALEAVYNPINFPQWENTNIKWIITT